MPPEKAMTGSRAFRGDALYAFLNEPRGEGRL